MKSKPHTVYHKDGSVWAVGYLRDGATNGYWEWFRKDGTKSRSGHFENGHQVGEWITYDKAGKPHKVTQIKPKDTTERIPFTRCSE
ncbi:MAG: hypothetical protein RLZZ245_3404 [Verrucomicrobiota bacterium]|jgi:antitoxin component YwqK of YwqJK toxin-antitoxin module